MKLIEFHLVLTANTSTRTVPSEITDDVTLRRYVHNLSTLSPIYETYVPRSVNNNVES